MVGWLGATPKLGVFSPPLLVWAGLLPAGLAVTGESKKGRGRQEGNLCSIRCPGRDEGQG